MTVNDADEAKMLHTSSRLGLLFGIGTITIDGAKQMKQTLPMLLIPLHFMTYAKE